MLKELLPEALDMDGVKTGAVCGLAASPFHALESGFAHCLAAGSAKRLRKVDHVNSNVVVDPAAYGHFVECE